MPVLLDAARVHATEGEIVEVLQEVGGSFTPGAPTQASSTSSSAL